MKKTTLLLLAAMVMSGCAHNRIDLRANDLGKNAKTMAYGGAIQRNSPDPIEREAGNSLKHINAFVVKVAAEQLRQEIAESGKVY